MRKQARPGRQQRVLCLLFLACNAAHAQTSNASPLELVKQMAQAESDAVKAKQHFLYRRHEQSSRTKGHTWDELVIEVPEGRMHRLISVDGKPLSESQKRAETARIEALKQHPDEVARDNQGRKEDESRTTDLLRLLPKLFLFSSDGMEHGCLRIQFTPNPDYKEQSYEERILHAMAGSLLIHPGDARLCRLDGHLQHQVEFGFGLLGRVSSGGGFTMVREQVQPGQWKTSELHVHADGNIFFMKSVSRQEDSVHFGFQQVNYNLSVAESADMILVTTY